MSDSGFQDFDVGVSVNLTSWPVLGAIVLIVAVLIGLVVVGKRRSRD